MKPGDHPEFFTRPPPPGRSRESTIVLDEQGRFWHDGALVTHQGMAEAFASWIDRHPLDGRYILNNGYDWSYFRVEGLPFHVRNVKVEENRLLVQLAGGEWEPLDPSSLHVGADEALICQVRGGRFQARFSPSAQLALAPYLVEGPDGEPRLQLGTETYPLPGSTPR